MKLWKNLTSFLLCAVLILSLFPAGILQAGAEETTVAYAVEGGNLYFDKSTGTIASCDPAVTSANIPSEIDGVPVTSIGNAVFSPCHNLTTVTIPNSVTSIGSWAFVDCIELTDVTIPHSVTSIGDHAFVNCDSLTSVTIPDSITAIADSTFSGCSSLINVTIPDSVTTIDTRAFAYCSSLTSVTIPDSVTTIGNYGFYSCSSLVNVTIPDSITAIADSTFSGCSSLTNVTIPDGVTTIGDSAFESCYSLTSITIPDGVTTIGSSVFCDCLKLTDVTIPDSVTSIGNRAFVNCDSLTNITIPGSVTTIDDQAFIFCNNLTSVTIGDSVTTIGEAAFYYCYNLTDVYYIGSEEQWNMIDIKPENEPLLFATIHFNYDPIKNPFVDVKESDYFAQPVLWAVEKGITNGTSAGKFSPDRTCTRGQVVTFLWRAAGSPEPETTENPFTDVDAKEYYYKAVLWAVENGITSGTGKGKFSPDKECTRAQVATFLWRAQGEPAPVSMENTFSDVEPGTYYYNAVLWAVEQGITNGTGKGKFSPENSCTRGQIVTFLYRALS